VRVRRVGIVMVVGLFAAMFTTITGVDAQQIPVCGNAGPLEARTLPARIPPDVCDLVGRVIEDHGAAVTVGSPGTSVYTEEILEDGWTQEFQVTTAADGTVYVALVGDEASDADEAPDDSGIEEDAPFGGSPAPCNDPGKNPVGDSETDTHKWYFNRDTAPVNQPSSEPQMTRDEVEVALREGTRDITQTINNCDMADNVRTTSASYEGNTNRRAEVTAGGVCDGDLAMDGQNTVDFGDLPAGKVGKACKWTFPQPGDDELMESDIRLNKVDYNWTLHPRASSCDNDYDVEGVMAHERGHTFGMGHVNEDNHKWLTMSPKVNAGCKAGVRTLGKGDVLALREIYGTN
jgi:Matrixin